jgi:hypothetical protein
MSGSFLLSCIIYTGQIYARIDNGYIYNISSSHQFHNKQKYNDGGVIATTGRTVLYC